MTKRIFLKGSDTAHFQRIRHFMNKRYQGRLVDQINDCEVLVYLPEHGKPDQSFLSKISKPVVFGADIVLQNDFDFLKQNIGFWSKNIDKNAQWHVYEARGSECVLPSCREKVSQMITDCTGGTYHDKPYGPKGEVSQGDVTSTYEETRSFLHEITVSIFTGAKKWSVTVKLSDETALVDSLIESINAVK